MIAAERRNRIKEIVLTQGAVKVSELVVQFGVSEETIRRDLNELEREGLVEKNYGGALAVEETRQMIAAIPNVHQRKIENLEEKTAIAAKAASIVQEGQVILLDSGSTTWCLARQLWHLQNLTIITNSVDIASSCSQYERWNIHVLGGTLNKRSMCLIGPTTQYLLQNYNVDICFLGTSGVVLSKGFTSSDIYESQIKDSMVKISSKVVVLADSSKFDNKGLSTFARFSDVDSLYVTDKLDAERLRHLKSQIGDVVVCSTQKQNGGKNYEGKNGNF